VIRSFFILFLLYDYVDGFIIGFCTSLNIHSGCFIPATPDKDNNDLQSFPGRIIEMQTAFPPVLMDRE